MVEKASGKVGIVRDDPDSYGNVRLQWADLSISGHIKAAALREATAEEKAAFEQQRQACMSHSSTPCPRVHECVFRWPASVASLL